jgi:hypothetical protein
MTNRPQIAAAVTTVATMISHGSIAPSAARSGTTIGADGGRNVSTCASSDDGSSVTSRIAAR